MNDHMASWRPANRRVLKTHLKLEKGDRELRAHLPDRRTHGSLSTYSSGFS